MIRKAILSLSFFFWASLAQAEVVIAALGDSLTQGFGLFEEDGFVPQLERWLKDAGHDVQIMNAGVSGDTTSGGLSRVDWTLSDQVDAMIVALGGNDLLRGIDPALSRENLTGILEKAGARGVEVLLIGMEAPGNYGPDYKTAFDSIYPDLAAEYGTVYLESFFVGFGEAQDDWEAVLALMQPDGIHPNAEGVAKIVEGVGPKVVELITRVGS